MALTDSQGTKVYLAAAGTDVSTALAIGTAITGGKEIGCIQDLGELSESRNVQEYACLGTDEIQKSLGSFTLGNISVGMLFDAADTAGQADLKSMFADGSERVAIVALSADGGATASYYFTFNVKVSGQSISITKDNAVMINSTVELTSRIAEVSA